MTLRTRFAPSPTGYLHIGGVRTALFSWLYARRHGGDFILRIEDTDRARSTQASVDAILQGLEWVGLSWDEGPYFQSERLDRYQSMAEKLLDQGLAYRCYCTTEELDDLRASQVAAGQNPGYDGRCRHRHTPRAGVDPVIRFRMPDAGQLMVDDQVRGKVVFENADFDDLIIMRSDGSPTFHFTVVVDDADMEITHVIRGDDHLNNTPKQVNLIKALNLPVPVYAHVPMILGEDGSRLSKRHGAVSVLEYREQGYLPAALINYLARLGWSHGDQEIFSLAELIELFDIADVNASASKFNPDKLKWVNQQYIQVADARDLIEDLRCNLVAEGLDPDKGPALELVIEAFRERAISLREMAKSAHYLFRDFDAFDPAAAKKTLRPVIQKPLFELRNRLADLDDWHRDSIRAAVEATAAAFDLGFGKLGQPLRVALSGGSVSPPIDVTAELVGRQRALARLDAALSFIEQRAAAVAPGDS